MSIWNEINAVNLIENILPTRTRAFLILERARIIRAECEVEEALVREWGWGMRKRDLFPIPHSLVPDSPQRFVKPVQKVRVHAEPVQRLHQRPERECANERPSKRREDVVAQAFSRTNLPRRRILR